MKMIFTDLDGTLLNSSSEISTINAEAIKKRKNTELKSWLLRGALISTCRKF